MNIAAKYTNSWNYGVFFLVSVQEFQFHKVPFLGTKKYKKLLIRKGVWKAQAYTIQYSHLFQFSGVYGQTVHTYSHIFSLWLSANLVELSAGVNLFSCDQWQWTIRQSWWLQSFWTFVGSNTQLIFQPPLLIKTSEQWKKPNPGCFGYNYRGLKQKIMKRKTSWESKSIPTSFTQTSRERAGLINDIN